MIGLRRAAPGLMFVYLLAVAFIVLWPSSDPAGAAVEWMTQVLAGLGAPGWMSEPVVEFVANVALFVPLSFLGSLIVPGWWRWVLTGFALTVGIELFQLMALSGRSARVSDVVSNSIGAVIGASVALPVRSRLSRR